MSYSLQSYKKFGSIPRIGRKKALHGNTFRQNYCIPWQFSWCLTRNGLDTNGFQSIVVSFANCYTHSHTYTQLCHIRPISQLTQNGEAGILYVYWCWWCTIHHHVLSIYDRSIDTHFEVIDGIWFRIFCYVAAAKCVSVWNSWLYDVLTTFLPVIGILAARVCVSVYTMSDKI